MEREYFHVVMKTKLLQNVSLTLVSLQLLVHIPSRKQVLRFVWGSKFVGAGIPCCGFQFSFSTRSNLNSSQALWSEQASHSTRPHLRSNINSFQIKVGISLFESYFFDRVSEGRDAYWLAQHWGLKRLHTPLGSACTCLLLLSEGVSDESLYRINLSTSDNHSTPISDSGNAYCRK